METRLTMATARWRWRVAVGLGVAVVVLFFAHGIWGIVAQRRLTATLAALAAAGEPLTAADLHLGAGDPPAADNASLDYRRAADLIDESAPAWRRYDETPAGAFTPPLTADERSMATELCRDNAAVLAAVAAGRGKLAGAWHDPFAATTLLPSLGTTRRASVLLSLAAADAAARGDGPTAVSRLADAVAIADAAERRPTLVGHLVAIGMTAVAAEAVDRTMPLVTVAAADRPAAEALLAALQDERPMRAGAQLSWRSERVTVTHILRELTAGRFSALAAGLTATGSAPAGPPAAVPQNAPVLYLVRPLLVSDTAAYVAHLDGLRRAALAPDLPTACARSPTALPAAIADHPVLHLMVQIFTPAFDKAMVVDYRALADRRLAAVAVAARLFAADHGGRPPTGWPDLVPAYLPAVPVDAMDGRPMRIADGPPRAWSVGEDGRDDGGVVPDERKPVRLRHGDDVAFFGVHPRPAEPGPHP